MAALPIARTDTRRMVPVAAGPPGADNRDLHPRSGQDVVTDIAEDAAMISDAVARAKAGDREALRYLYVRYADNVYGYVNSIVRDEHEAEDLTQHVFAKLMTVLPRYEQRDVPFFAWILRVARNVALDHLRQRRPIPCEEIRSPHATDDTALADELRATLTDALRDLPADQREVLVLRHVAGLAPAEIAHRLGKSESSIHGLHHRGRGALRVGLAARGTVPSAAVA